MLRWPGAPLWPAAAAAPACPAKLLQLLPSVPSHFRSHFLPACLPGLLAPPPPQVLISRGEIDSYFWVNLLLTLVGWLPGVAHAVWVLCSRNPLARECGGGTGPARFGVHVCALASALPGGMPRHASQLAHVLPRMPGPGMQPRSNSSSRASLPAPCSACHPTQRRRCGRATRRSRGQTATCSTRGAGPAAGCWLPAMEGYLRLDPMMFDL